MHISQKAGEQLKVLNQLVKVLKNLKQKYFKLKQQILLNYKRNDD